MRKRPSFVPSHAWRDRRHRRGLAGERVAAQYLMSCGWEVEAHRFRCGRREIDLVVRRGRLVVFVEVKTRRSLALGGPLEAVSPAKRRIVARVAEGWRQRFGRRDDEYRFDVVGVTVRRAGVLVEHVADAWRIGL